MAEMCLKQCSSKVCADESVCALDHEVKSLTLREKVCCSVLSSSKFVEISGLVLQCVILLGPKEGSMRASTLM